MTFIKHMKKFFNSWTGTIVIVMFLISFIAQSFLIPSGSMKSTLLTGDFVFGKKFPYGTVIPRIPWLEIPLYPDINNNGHIISGEGPKREDIVIFYYPSNTDSRYVKRCVAVGDDEIIYTDKKLYIHFNEGDSYIKSNYPKSKTIFMMNKLWVENPYINKYPGINYTQINKASIFENLLLSAKYGKEINMKPIYIENLKGPRYNINSSIVNALYTKVPKNEYYMVGDNRENSNDSRFWGPVPYKFIIGKPWFIYFSFDKDTKEVRWNRIGKYF